MRNSNSPKPAGAGGDPVPHACRPADAQHSRLLRHRQEADGHEHDQAQARLRTVQGPLGVRRRRLAHVRERLDLQQEDVAGLQVLYKGEFLS